jgi:hypothetical protein
MTDRPSLEDLDAPLAPARWCCGGNAEDCPLCTEPNLPYPFLCPGHPRTAANERIVGETSQGPDRTPGYVNPPGGTSEQLPADILAAINLPVYVSTACETALRLEDAAVAAAREDRDGDVDRFMEWAGRLHERCRLNHKFTGVCCACNHHGEASR